MTQVTNMALYGYSDTYKTETTTRSIEFAGATSATATFATAAAAANTVSVPLDVLQAKAVVSNAFVLSGVRFKRAGREHVVKSDGSVQTSLNPATGIGTAVGSLNGTLGLLAINAWTAGESPQLSDWRGIEGPPVSGPFTPFNGSGVLFRTATSPIRPQSFTLQGAMRDGTTLNVGASAEGYINTARVKGRINYEFGLVEIYFVRPTAPAGSPEVDLSFLGIPGVGLCFTDLAEQDTLRYNAVAYTYLPLDADAIGIDPVRLPTDGRVPIIRAGDLVVVGHTKRLTNVTVTNGQTIDLARTRLSRVRVLGSDKAPINAGYTADLEAGTITATDTSTWMQPVTIEDRIEDMVTVRDAQINGQLEFLRPVTHDYPAGSVISSVLRIGNMRARVSLLLNQGTWTGEWSDALIGAASTAKYNDTLSPIVVTNAGALNERWALQFTTSSDFRVIGEHVGVLGSWSINGVCAPINPSTGQPYFTINPLGWGTGWAAGNVVRLNTVGAIRGEWLVRTVQQGPETVLNDEFTVLIRGDVDRP